MADAGLFGPGSVTWRVHADPLTGLGGLRALLLQALHPVAIAAVSEHSRFAEDSWGRLRDTADYLGTTTFGTTVEALLAGARIRAVHGTVSGVEPGTGREYRGGDEALLLWLHCCLVDSLLTVVRRGGLALTEQQANRYVAEQVRAAALVGLEPDVVPSTTAALAEHIERTRRDLAVTPAARRMAAAVVAPSVAAADPGRRFERPAWAGVAGLAFACLPGWARRMYAMTELPGPAGLSDGAATVALRAVRDGLSGAHAVIPALQQGPPRGPDGRVQSAGRSTVDTRREDR